MNNRLENKKFDSNRLNPIQKGVNHLLSSGGMSWIVNNTTLRLYSVLIGGRLFLPDEILEQIVSEKLGLSHNGFVRDETGHSLAINHLSGKLYWNRKNINTSIGRITEIFSDTYTKLYDKVKQTGHEDRNLEPKISKTALPVKNLPDNLNGISIFHITDMHVSRLNSFFSIKQLNKCVDILNKSLSLEKSSNRPAIVVFTGDFFTDHEDGMNIGLLEKCIGAITCIRADVKIAILGNHDYIVGKERMVQFWKRCGFQVLNNDVSRIMEIGNSRIQFSGTGDLLFLDANFEQTLGKAKECFPDLLIDLVHEPETYVDRVNCPGTIPHRLTFSGHTHGPRLKRIENVVHRLETITRKIHNRHLATLNLKRDNVLSEEAFGYRGGLSYMSGFYYNEKNHSWLVISPGLGQIYVANSRQVPAIVNQVELRKME